MIVCYTTLIASILVYNMLGKPKGIHGLYSSPPFCTYFSRLDAHTFIHGESGELLHSKSGQKAEEIIYPDTQYTSIKELPKGQCDRK